MDIQELKNKCREMFDLRAEIEAEEAITKEKNKRLEAMKMQITDALDELELPNFDTGFGKVIRVNKINAKCTDRVAFHNWLKEQGLFEDLVSVNYQTLNGFYKERHARAVEEQDADFSVPGVETSVHSTIQMRGVDK